MQRTRLMEEFNASAGATRRRTRLLDVLALKPGEHVLDVGSGPGHYAFDMASAVGDTGRVAGVDNAEDSLETARRRCAGLANVSFHLGDAVDLPFDEATFDAALSTQTFEYLPDVGAALAEIFRVLKPGGRVLIHDTEWDAWAWHSSDRARMHRIMEVWDKSSGRSASAADAGLETHRRRIRGCRCRAACSRRNNLRSREHERDLDQVCCRLCDVPRHPRERGDRLGRRSSRAGLQRRLFLQFERIHFHRYQAISTNSILAQFPQASARPQRCLPLAYAYSGLSGWYAAWHRVGRIRPPRQRGDGDQLQSCRGLKQTLEILGRSAKADSPLVLPSGDRFGF